MCKFTPISPPYVSLSVLTPSVVNYGPSLLSSWQKILKHLQYSFFTEQFEHGYVHLGRNAFSNCQTGNDTSRYRCVEF